ncbi:hypothetical protein QOZ80_6BG0479820 [Eleusine coracana subsp. coracana]|nr:hypothetical protein QOZ80_6BG0479820 [Eleusine coracana subsp. coracana]
MMDETPSTLTTRSALGTTDAMRKNVMNEGWMPDGKTDETTDEMIDGRSTKIPLLEKTTGKTDGTTNGTIVRILLQETTATTHVNMMIGIGAIMMAINDVVMMRISAHATVVAQLRPQTDPAVRIWLTSLPEESVTSWGDLNRKLIESFQASCNRPGNHFDLTRIKQKGDEPLHDYIKRFCAKKTEIPNIPDQQIITAFLGGIRSDDLVREIGWRNHNLKLIAQERFEITDKYESGPEAYTSKRKQKLELREINSMEPAIPQYMRWTEMPITFDRSDHSKYLPKPGCYPLVLAATMKEVKFNRVLIDGGSSLDLIFTRTLQELGLSTNDLQPSSSPFHGIVPGKTSVPIGQISLSVTFGTRDNFRTERILFQVADFESAYHAIIGRSMMARFMAVPHYPYLTLKMPGPNGIIFLHFDLWNSFDCDVQSYEMATKLLMLSDQKEIQKAVDIEEQTEVEVPTKKPAKDKIQTNDIQTKEISLDPEDPDKVTYAVVNLDEK